MGNCQQSSVEGSTHSVTLTTGDRKRAGADNVNVFIKFTDEEGQNSEETLITNIWKNDFRQGQTEKFQLLLPNLRKITDICIRRDSSGKTDAWFVERINITHLQGKSSTSEFPLNRWIHADDKLCISEFDCCLPHEDKYPEQREKELKAKREVYVLAEKIIGGPPQNEILPEDERFSNEYEWDIASIYVKQKIKTTFVDLTSSEFDSLADFEAVFKQANLDVPEGIKKWRSDEEFGNQKLAGCNPVLLQLCTSIPDHLGVTSELVKPHLEGKSLEALLTANRIYIIDLRYLADIECSEGRKLPGPTCLLYVKESGDLVPIAIQLMPEPGEDNPVFTPSDPEYTWLAAKMWYNMAESSDHESATHLGHTHLLMDAVATCSNRELSPSHPIFKLLAPHFIFILAINDSAVASLVSPGGWVDKAMHVGRIGMFNIIKEKWATWNLQEDGNLPKNLKKRGVDDVKVLPNYHYRDDALLLWNTIRKYVEAVVNQVYDTEDKLLKDVELEAWRKDLVGDANFKGMPDKFSTNEDLIEVLIIFMFIPSVSHAAVNFGQYDEYAFMPNYPAALNKLQWPTSKEALTEEYIVESLPPKEKALDIVFLTRVLSQRGSNSLGDYERRYAYGPILEPALERFRSELEQVAKVIDGRNSKRVRKYPYLNPRVVPNSISI